MKVAEYRLHKTNLILGGKLKQHTTTNDVDEQIIDAQKNKPTKIEIVDSRTSDSHPPSS